MSLAWWYLSPASWRVLHLSPPNDVEISWSSLTNCSWPGASSVAQAGSKLLCSCLSFSSPVDTSIHHHTILEDILASRGPQCAFIRGHLKCYCKPPQATSQLLLRTKGCGDSWVKTLQRLRSMVFFVCCHTVQGAARSPSSHVIVWGIIGAAF